MQQNIPSIVSLGVINKKTTKFDDGKELIKEGGCTKINAIKVFFDEKYIIGVTLYYKLADGDYLKAAHNPQKDKKKIQKRVLEIGPDDYLNEISGHATEKGITRITFQTYRGKIGTYGSDEGTPFIYKFQGQTFGPFAGGFRDHIEHLEVPVYPVPQEFLAQFNPIIVSVTVNEKAGNKLIGQQPGQGGQIQQTKFTGMYVNPVAQQGQVMMPQINIPKVNVPLQPQQQYMYQPQPQQIFQQPQQQFVPPQQQQVPQYQQQQQPQQQNNVLSSKYPSFK